MTTIDIILYTNYPPHCSLCSLHYTSAITYGHLIALCVHYITPVLSHMDTSLLSVFTTLHQCYHIWTPHCSLCSLHYTSAITYGHLIALCVHYITPVLSHMDTSLLSVFTTLHQCYHIWTPHCSLCSLHYTSAITYGHLIALSVFTTLHQCYHIWTPHCSLCSLHYTSAITYGHLIALCVHYITPVLSHMDTSLLSVFTTLHQCYHTWTPHCSLCSLHYTSAITYGHLIALCVHYITPVLSHMDTSLLSVFTTLHQCYHTWTPHCSLCSLHYTSAITYGHLIALCVHYIIPVLSHMDTSLLSVFTTLHQCYHTWTPHCSLCSLHYTSAITYGHLIALCVHYITPVLSHMDTSLLSVFTTLHQCYHIWTPHCSLCSLHYTSAITYGHLIALCVHYITPVLSHMDTSLLSVFATLHQCYHIWTPHCSLCSLHYTSAITYGHLIALCVHYITPVLSHMDTSLLSVFTTLHQCYHIWTPHCSLCSLHYTSAITYGHLIALCVHYITPVLSHMDTSLLIRTNVLMINGSLHGKLYHPKYLTSSH